MNDQNKQWAIHQAFTAFGLGCKQPTAKELIAYAEQLLSFLEAPPSRGSAKNNKKSR